MKRLLSGNEAIAYGAYEAGCRFGVGYPGTPSTEILQNFVKYPGAHLVYEPVEIREVAAKIARRWEKSTATSSRNRGSAYLSRVLGMRERPV